MRSRCGNSFFPFLRNNQKGKDYASLRYFWDKPADHKEHRLPLAEIKKLSDKAETDYYTYNPVDFAKTGQALYNWLDKSDRVLANALQEPHQEGLIIAIATDKGLAHLPWELLHDGQSFLVEKRPSIIPVRWVSKGKSQPITSANSPQNRPLNLLFMATSPLGVKPELNYEAEEGQILESTQRTSIDLRVEESGCLEELGYVVGEYESDHFDVFHLTGHATHEKDEKPCFLTEDEYGGCVYSNAEDIANALQFSLPSLIFLSGCRTGYSSDDAVPSMAEELLNMGANTVLAWGEKVLNTDATAASRQFYKGLSQGRKITQALSSTYQALIRQQARDWHKLRFYVATTLPQSLVTPLMTPKRKQLPNPTTALEFRDDENHLRVARREEFVGRRRQLQNCLRTLKTDYEKVGVLLHGMGGWGKSSIASRLWDRLPEHDKILWWRQINESYLIRKLKDKLIKPSHSQLELILYLENSQIPLKARFAYLFNQLAKPFLFILDDFEWNLEPREGRYILKPGVAPILKALVEAIQETGTKHRIIITCRYEFDSELLGFFFSQGLEPLRKAELTKKLNRLKYFNSVNLSEDIRNRALELADGNPRLLEFLNNEVLGRKDAEAKLTELEQSPPKKWKDEIIWEELYQLIDEPLQQVFSHCLVYELPVPMVALEAVCDSLSNYQKQLQRGLDLGLIEMSPELREEDRVYRVSRILPHIIPTIQLPEAPKVYSLYHKAHDKLHELGGHEENFNEEIWREIFRLLFADKENPLRFRQGFSEMLAVQDNGSADKALESELRRLKDELSEENFCCQLENYLRQGDWRKADEETAWLFYLVIVQQRYEPLRFELCREFPTEILNEIDQLWVNYSKGQFGFSIQKRIWESLESLREGNTDIDDSDHLDTKLRKFGKQVEWIRAKDVENVMTFSTESPEGQLPALVYMILSNSRVPRFPGLRAVEEGKELAPWSPDQEEWPLKGGKKEKNKKKRKRKRKNDDLVEKDSLELGESKEKGEEENVYLELGREVKDMIREMIEKSGGVWFSGAGAVVMNLLSRQDLTYKI